MDLPPKKGASAPEPDCPSLRWPEFSFPIWRGNISSLKIGCFGGKARNGNREKAARRAAGMNRKGFAAAVGVGDDQASSCTYRFSFLGLLGVKASFWLPLM